MSETTRTYNGWTNYETWAVALHLGNDAGTQACWCEHAEDCYRDAVAADPDAGNRSRVSILLANDTQDQTLTITHVLWAMFGILPEGKVQPPHRHQSVALDLILDCRPGCYTLLGASLESCDLLRHVIVQDREVLF